MNTINKVSNVFIGGLLLPVIFIFILKNYETEYRINFQVIIRLLLFVSILGFLGLQIIIKSTSNVISKKVFYLKITSLFLAIVIITIVLIKIYNGREPPVYLAYFSAILICCYYTWLCNKDWMWFRPITFFIYGLLIGLLIYSFFSLRYLNSESSVDLTNLIKENYELVEMVNSKEIIKLTKEDVENFESNYKKAIQNQYYVPYLISKDKQSIEIPKLPGVVAALCLFGQYKLNLSYPYYTDAETCIRDISRLFRNSDLVESFEKIPGIDNKFRGFVRENFSIFDKHISKTETHRISTILGIEMLKGGFFHHYQSIANGIFDGIIINKIVNNQYGPGPLVLVSMISRIFDATLFDSIFYLTCSVNLLICLFVLFMFRKISHKENALIINSLLASLLITFGLSNFMAPFLYPVRYFPQFCLLIYFSYSILNGIKVNIIFLILLSILALLYNFEYGVFLLVAYIATAFYCKENFKIYISLVIALGYILIKQYYFISPDIGTNYLAYIYGVGMSEDVGLITISFFALLFPVILVLIGNRKNLSNFPALVFLGFLFLLMSVKVIWNGSPNHIGFLFFYFTILLVIYLNKFQLSISKESIYAVHFVYLTTVVIFSLIQLPLFNLSAKIPGVAYEFGSMSKVARLSSTSIERISDFSKIYQNGDLVVSPIDNMLSLSINNKITQPYPDVSTNINSAVDFDRILPFYLANKRVIVDKDVSNIIGLSELLFFLSPRLFSPIYNYNNTMTRMLDLVQLIKKNRYECGNSDYFIAYCID